jgi:thiol-disulfide isomerase/thioredoxin
MFASLFACAAIMMASALAADDPPSSPAGQYQALVKASEKARNDFNQAYQAATTDAERQQIARVQGRQSAPDAFAAQFLTLIQRYPQDQAALDAFWWLMSRVRNAPETEDAVDVLLRYRMEDAELAKTCQSLTHYYCRAGEKLLRAAIERSPHRTVQGQARFSLALFLRHRASRQNSENRQGLESEAERLLQEVIKNFSDLKFQTTTLGQAANLELFELKNLSIGKTAPEIEGLDLQGKPMKLSEFQGKIVLVVFWATWCGPCMADVPHEVELLKQYHQQPFAIVGVNADERMVEALKACLDYSIPWRSFHDGKSSGPISTRWNVRSWPILYLIDQKGTIRYKTDDLRSIFFRKDKNGNYRQTSSLDDAIERLLKEVAEKEKK